ncbi:Eco57I restriction-modification methylase domain-containing protein [Vibrio alginolyticus]
MNTDLTRSIEQVTTIDELVRQFEALLAVDISDTPKGHQRLKANQLAKDILAKYNGDYSNVSPEDKAALRDYTGFGGIGGSTNEYYTPKWLASATWDAVRSYGFTGGSVLEPSSGVGVFSETKPKGTLTTSVEMDQTSAAINQILHPEDHVIQSAFEAVATNPGIGDFDLVIGNPPYGVRDASAMKDKAYKDIKYADQYFVSRSIDKAKADLELLAKSLLTIHNTMAEAA